MENGEKKILSPVYFGSFASREYRSDANRLFAATTLFPLSGVGLPAFGCDGIALHPAKAMLRTTSDVRDHRAIVFASMAERLPAGLLNVMLGAVFFAVIV
jgi:hypothetical protein